MKSTFCTIFIESLLFSPIGVNFSPVEQLAWKARFVQFSWKAHCFPFLERIYGQCDDFDNFEKCDLANTSSEWRERHVLYNFHRKPTVFTYWRKFQSSRAIFESKTSKNAIWPKRPPHGVESTFCTIFIERLLFSPIGVNFSPLRANLGYLKRWKMRFGQNVSSAWREKHVLYNFHRKLTVFTYWREFQSSRAIFGPKTSKNAIWPKRRPHGVKSTFWTIFIESLLFSRIGVNFSPVEQI